MNLPRCPEPKKLWEKKVEDIRKASTPDIFFIVLNPRGLPSYLWTQCGWNKILKEKEIRWQDFLKILSSNKHNVKKWIHGDLSWQGFIGTMEKSALEFYLHLLMEKPVVRDITSNKFSQN